MSTNNKWQALSMKDRAFLIREAVRNGITDINSIRDTWEHRFDGESNQPTEDEYIAKQAQNKINKALHNARSAEDVPELWVEKNANMKTSDTFHYDNAKKKLEDAKKELQKLSLRALQTNIYGQETFDNEMRRYELRSKIPELETTVRNYQKLCEQGLVPGFTCINTVTGYYDRPETWNVRFAKQHEQKGFKKIPYSEIAPGDIVQFKNSDNNPTHALMANTAYTPNSSDMRYNGSNGQSGKEALRINAKYPTEWDKVDAYRYVGNKADSLQWKKEYREKYGHQFSGEKNHPDHGVQYELKKKSIYTPDLNNPFKKFSTAEDAPPASPKQDLHFEWLRPVDEAIARGSGFLYDPLFYEKNKILRDKVYNTFYSLDDPDSDINIPEEYEILNREQVRKLLPKRDYIGGKTPKETRDKVASLIPGLIDSLQSISSRHKINPELLHYRISKEGYYDKKASKYNYEINKDEMPEYWNNVANQEVNGFSELGLDDAGELLEKGLIKITRPISYETIDATNEKDRNVTSVVTPNLWDALEIKAGDIKYRQEEMRKRGVPAEDLDTWTNAAYNLGLYHEDLNNEAWIRKNYTLPSYGNFFKK